MSNVIISNTGRPDTKHIVVSDGKLRVKEKQKTKNKEYYYSKCDKAFSRSWLLNRHLNRKTRCIKSEEDIRGQLYQRYNEIYKTFQNEWQLFLQLPKVYQDREKQNMRNYIEMVAHEINKIKNFIEIENMIWRYLN